tara:strand:+ start:6957 stop:7970 length:1014 start_codon:yes stop_codon:yes gene_type:complete
MSVETEDENLIYYNIDITNDTSERIIPNFDVNRVDRILDNPSDYEMSVVRFSISLSSIPLFQFIENDFIVSLAIGEFIFYPEPLVWIPNNSVYDEKNVYDIQHLLDMLNNAWSLAFTFLKAGNTVVSTTPPFMTYSALTNLISLNVPKTYVADNIDIYTNSNLHRRLHSFYDFYNEFPSTGVLNYRFIVQDLFDNYNTFNGIDYFYFTQQFSSIASLSDLRSIQVFTNSVPVNKELLGSQLNIVETFLTDFEPVESNTFSSNGLYQFFPEGPLRYIDLLSNEPMKRFDLAIKWTKKSSEVVPYYLEPNENISLKIKFRKKQNLILDDFIHDMVLERN